MKTKTYLQRTAQQVIASSPPKCYTVTEHEGQEILVAVIAGASGFHSCTTVENPQEAADYLNRSLGITAKQVEAMIKGSQFGWHCAAADPDNPINQ
jgi:hypothetical protein|tara:strand:- start:92 stop:379 length:288 start_codon:yes stop_codon:yes gene_type:complete